MTRTSTWKLFTLFALLITLAATDRAQTTKPEAQITQVIDETRRVTLAGNTRPEAIPANDRGPVPDELHLDMYLQLKRSPERDAAAKEFVESLTDKSSPNYHKWITAAEYGERFGAGPDDIATITRWLRSHGLSVNRVPSHNMVIDFSGNAGQVRQAFGTELHYLDVKGKRHFANMSDPQIPAALHPAITGVVSLSDIMPDKMVVPIAQYTVSPTSLYLVPGDLATIYNLNPAFAAGYTGQGQTVVVVEDSDLYNGNSDWNTFRKTFGLNQYSAGSLTISHPTGGAGGSCLDPGVGGAADEAALDVEWASAAAPNAAIVMASCADTTNFGGFIALQNILTNKGTLPSVVSISYGEAETQTGAAENSYTNVLYQLAASMGVSVFVSSGDAGPVTADRFEFTAVFGITVSSFASTPYNVAVGGTDFSDFSTGTGFNYWSPANSPYYNSALSYVPEIPWNDSCGGSVAAGYYGFSVANGNTDFCNSRPFYGNGTAGGSGGPSGCATGARANGYAVSGTCAGWPKPSWQSIPGNPNDGVRDLPDVSLFASNGFWGHVFVYCDSLEASCSGAPSTWALAGGTSFSSPIMAGIQAVINQAMGVTNVGNPNPVYYAIANNQFSTPSGLAACNSTTGPAANCSFNDVTQGDIVVPCSGSFNCYSNGRALGVLSTSDASYQPAYAATPGWDFATGIGTVNAYNLLTAFVDFANPLQAPAAPVLVSPANNASPVSPAPVLTWNASAGATSYDVYFGSSAPPPLVTTTTSLNYTPGGLNPAATYYWAIGGRNSAGATASQPWSFTTDCVSAISPLSTTAPSTGGTGSIPVNAAAGCQWTATSNAAWITITSGNSGTGSGSVSYTVAPASGAQQTGTLTVAGQPFTVTQTGIYPLISTLAGGGLPATPAPGPSVSFPVTYGLATDAAGNTYFPSPTLNAVFKADPNGIVTRIAGTGTPGSLGEGGPALQAELRSPEAVTVDGSGNVYIADTSNYRIAKVDSNGMLTTVAGSHSFGYAGDTGPAIIATIGLIYGLAVDGSGNLYLSDSSNSVVRKVDTTGVITTYAGTGTSGFSGDGGPAASAKLNQPYGLTIDGAGNVYIADRFNNRVRKATPDGYITTVAGTGSSSVLNPAGVAVDGAGNIYTADYSLQRVRKTDPSGNVTTVAGTGTSGYAGDGGPAASARLYDPSGVALDGSGNVYVSESGTNRIRQIDTHGVIHTWVGGATGDGGPAVFGSLTGPAGVVRDNAGNTFISDYYNNLVRKVSSSGVISTVAGSGVSGFAGDAGPAINAQLYGPRGLALDAAGNLYIADINNARIRKVDTSGNIDTVAGNGKSGVSSGDGGPATNAVIGSPWSLALDSGGNLYIGDVGNNVVRQVDTTGKITTFAGTGSAGFSGDNGPAASAKLSGPYGIAIDPSGNLYIADYSNCRIRMVSGGTITTIAGTGTCRFSGDGGPAAKATVYFPISVTTDGAGNVYFSDYDSLRIRRIGTDGNINTVAGDGSSGDTGDGGLAVAATFRAAYAVASDAAGYLAIADLTTNSVRLLTPPASSPVLSIQSEHGGVFQHGQTGATYTLTVSNGTTAGPTTGPVTVTETVPAGLALVGLSGNGWTCTTAPTATCRRSDALNGGASYPPITVTVNVSASASTQVTNMATAAVGPQNVAGALDLTQISN